jgi:hypothetical protein
MSVWQRVGQDLTAALIAVGLVLLTTYGASRVLISAAPSPDDTEQTTSGRDPVAELEALPGSAAVIDASGFVEARLVLYHFVAASRWSGPMARQMTLTSSTEDLEPNSPCWCAGSRSEFREPTG